MTDYFGSVKCNRQRTTLRLVRIRNPWGKREWKGDWSVDSERWTRTLRNRLGQAAFSKGDGAFFMSFDDMLERFHHMDVAKTRKGWVHSNADGMLVWQSDPLSSSQYVYRLIPSERTWAFISVIQPKKRANTKTSYWYCDPSFLILRKKPDACEGDCEASILAGVKRSVTCEVFLDPTFDYLCIPFSCLAGSCTTSAPFRLATYSAANVTIKKQIAESTLELSAHLHRELLRRDHKLVYPVASRAILTCVHGDGCLYFIAINGASESFLSLKLIAELHEGVVASYGKADDTHDVPPRSQKLLMIISQNGRESTPTQLRFRYLSSIVEVHTKSPSSSMTGQGITLAGDLLTSSIDSANVVSKGNDVVDTHLRIPQLVSSVLGNN